MSEEKCQKHKNFRIYCASAFVIYLLIVLYITIFSREPEERRIDMELFRSYKLLFIDKNDFYYTQIVCNIIMTVPFGILFPVLNEKFRSVFLMFVSGLVFSLLIELAQYFSGRGLFEFDDLFNNTVGALLGYLILNILIRTFSSRREK
jgi:glycopeptide antibiotics resistance protein